MNHDLERPDPMMELLTDHRIHAPASPLADTRAAAVLAQMFGYHDQPALDETTDLGYGEIAA